MLPVVKGLNLWILGRSNILTSLDFVIHLEGRPISRGHRQMPLRVN